MGIAGVFKTQLRGQPCICKQGATKVEIDFYESMAPRLRQEGIHIPHLLCREGSDLYLEFIPHRVPPEEIHRLPDTFNTLVRIHRYRGPVTGRLKQHQWTASQTEAALEWLQLPLSAARALRGIGRVSNELFDSQGLISGDANPGNWGRRENGELVLFDWERFGRGSPAMDLAPLVPGMGTMGFVA